MKILLQNQILVLFSLISATLVAQNNSHDSATKWPCSHQVEVAKDITIAEYFPFMDTLVKVGDSVLNYPITEHILVRHNPWVLDTLVNTDYYRMIERDSFVYNQKELIALKRGTILKIPDSLTASKIAEEMSRTKIVVNIPEYRLRIIKDTIVLHSFPIRVGQDRTRYLAMGDRETNLRTKIGQGRIIRHVKNPDFYNPVNGKQFYITKRDDGRTTIMPQIPWIETEVNGIRNGQMIHPTTNPKSLGKAYSNGCIGTKEGDAWIIYYNAPIGTAIEIKYELLDKKGQTLKDIYSVKL